MPDPNQQPTPQNENADAPEKPSQEAPAKNPCAPDEPEKEFVRKHTVISSFSDQGFELYGARFIESCLAQFGDGIDLVIFHEGERAPEAGNAPERYADHHDIERINDIDWRHVDDVEGLKAYLENISKFPLMTGNAQSGYNINFDARMCRKSYMLRHAVKTIGGKVFWLDADSFVFDKITTGWLDARLPDDVFACYLGREHLKTPPGEAGPPTYTESGFLGMNANHHIAAMFVGVLVEILIESGAIFVYPGWHDCIAFDAVREQMQEKYPNAFINLSAGLSGGPTGHVFINSILGSKIDHAKGDRKFAGRSNKSDLSTPRAEKYWGGDGK